MLQEDHISFTDISIPSPDGVQKFSGGMNWLENGDLFFVGYYNERPEVGASLDDLEGNGHSTAKSCF